MIDDMESGCAAVFFAFVTFVTGFLVGGCTAVNFQRSQAVEAGVGRYVVDPVTGETNFRYGVAPAAAGVFSHR